MNKVNSSCRLSSDKVLNILIIRTVSSCYSSAQISTLTLSSYDVSKFENADIHSV